MNSLNRSFYLQSGLIQSARKVPSVTPTKNPSLSNLTKIRIRSRERQSQDTPTQTSRNLENNSNLMSNNRTNSEIQNLIKKQCVNDSFDRKKRGSPLDKSPINARLTTIHKSRQISVSQSQLALNQVLAQMQVNKVQDNEILAPMQRKQTYTTHIESNSSHKSTLNSHILTTNSSSKQQKLQSVNLDDYSKIVKELNFFTKQVNFLQQKIQLLEQVNKQMLNVSGQCQECSQKMDSNILELMINIRNVEMHSEKNLDDFLIKSINYNQSTESMENPTQKLINLQDQSYQQMNIQKHVQISNSEMPQIISAYYNHQMNNIAQDFFDDYEQLDADNQFFNTVIQQNRNRHFPSTLRALQLINQ